MNNIYAIIMAGGSGTRFWPLSRKRTPKQVLTIQGDNSMLQETISRLKELVSLEMTYIVTNKQQMNVITQQLPGLSKQNYIIEPVPRNTAPCIGLAALHIHNIDPDGIMIVLPADHLVKNFDRFHEVVRTGIEVVEKYNPLVTIGIPPTRPETGYGYIQFEQSDKDLPDNVYSVKTFAEKPNQETAELFVKSGNFYWNSGIFIWRASRILSEIEERLPDQFHQLQRIKDAIGAPNYQQVLSNYFKRIRPISIDYGVMEVTSTPIFMIEGNFGWSDVGSWDELYRIAGKNTDGNVFTGEVATIDAQNNYIYSPDQLTAIIGLNNLLVVNTPTATLICPLDRAQDVKEIVEKLNKEKKTRYL
ncbi:MAG: mannose-1-phosphate guanylyltransferase [Candidatus Hatepunaea meridiana]|nr:mannose-1-phosphate guanylyltransferase [Candidatus Hatepunaea meridiana]